MSTNACLLYIDKIPLLLLGLKTNLKLDLTKTYLTSLLSVDLYTKRQYQIYWNVLLVTKPYQMLV